MWYCDGLVDSAVNYYSLMITQHSSKESHQSNSERFLTELQGNTGITNITTKDQCWTQRGEYYCVASCSQGEGECVEELNIYSSCMHTLRIL